jgi:iron complex transport system permease protein
LTPARLAALATVVVLAAVASLLVGGTVVSPRDVFSALAHPGVQSDASTIVWQLRMPRAAIAAVVGCALAISGALLQGMLRNPLADPYLTGVSAGAAAAIVVGIAAGVPLAALPILGFVAGTATALVVAALARRGAGIDAQRLILAGVTLSSLFSAFITLVLTRSQTVEAGAAIVSWLAGSIGGRGWSDLLFAVPYGIAGLLLALASVPALNALRLGDVRASSIGVDVARAQWTILIATSLLTAAAVALAGTVGFVGLLSPHIARRFVGSDVRVVMPASAAIGAAMTLCADAASRSLFAPAELPIGVLLAFAGVPAFLYLYLRAARTAI